MPVLVFTSIYIALVGSSGISWDVQTHMMRWMNRYDRLAYRLSARYPVQKLPEVFLDVSDSSRYLTDGVFYRVVDSCFHQVRIHPEFLQSAVTFQGRKDVVSFTPGLALLSNSLYRLDLSDSAFSNISSLGTVPLLQHLDLRNTPISDLGENMKLSTHLPRLHYLNLGYTNIANLGALTGLTNLTSLVLINLPITSLTCLQTLPKLRHVYLHGCHEVESLDGTPAIPGMIVNLMDPVQEPNDGMEMILAVRNTGRGILSQIELNNPDALRPLQTPWERRYIGDLLSLQFTGTVFSKVKLVFYSASFLSCCIHFFGCAGFESPQMRFLALCISQVLASVGSSLKISLPKDLQKYMRETFMNRLDRLAWVISSREPIVKLSHVSLSYRDSLQYLTDSDFYRVVDSCFRKVEIHHQLCDHQLYLQRRKTLYSFTPAFSSLANTLMELFLSDTNFFDISTLGFLPRLTHLDLAYTPIADLGTATELRRRLPNLLYLNLQGTNVVSIEALRSLPILSSLVLRNTRITSLESLRTLPRLIKLFLHGTSVESLDPLPANPALIVTLLEPLHDTDGIQIIADAIKTNTGVFRQIVLNGADALRPLQESQRRNVGTLGNGRFDVIVAHVSPNRYQINAIHRK